MLGRLGGSQLLNASDYLRKRPCPVCGVPFKPVRDSMFCLRTNKSIAYYCSWSCYRKAKEQSNAKDHANLQQWQDRLPQLKQQMDLALRQGDTKQYKLIKSKIAYASNKIEELRYKLGDF